MPQERELARTSTDAAAQAPAGLDIAPGRDSRSARLAAPEHPLVSGLLQRKAERDANGVEPGADAAISTAALSSGSALPAMIQRKFESSLGADLSNVRVHTGGESQTAAHAVGAKAYTIGQDIHFGAGHYDPTGAAGEHLLAHEVAHTVQQQGGSASRQNKLEVSTPFDAAELEADRAADAMVSGATATIASASGVARKVMRETAPAPAPAGGAPAAAPASPAGGDAKQWATDLRTKVEKLQDAVKAAITKLNGDAGPAIASLQAATNDCKQFHDEYTQASQRFVTNVKEAAAQQDEFKKQLTAIFNVVLMGGSAGGSELAELLDHAKDVQEKAQDVGEAIGIKAEAPEDHAPNPPASGMQEAAWSVIDNALTTLKTFVQNNKALAAVASACIDSDRFLTGIVENPSKNDPKNDPKKDPKGLQAIKLGGKDPAGLVFQSIAASAGTFAATVHSDLTIRSLGNDRKIEQDLAIKWMSTLKANTGAGGTGSKELFSARAYLADLGVWGGRDSGQESRLGLNPGMWDTDTDDQMAIARAQIESECMGLIGKTGSWVVTSRVSGGEAWGSVSIDGKNWNAHGGPVQKDRSDPAGGGLPQDPMDAAGQTVRVSKYNVTNPTDKQIEEAGAGNAGSVALLVESMRAAVSLTVAVVGGGGAGGGGGGK